MLKVLDFIFLWLHIVIIIFNLIGWIWYRTRKLHLVVVFATIFSWLLLGLKYGLGYCFLTDWHWDIKRKLGETDMPASFIKYFTDRYTPLELSSTVVDQLTAIFFGLAVVLTIYVNFVHPSVFSRRR